MVDSLFQTEKQVNAFLGYVGIICFWLIAMQFQTRAQPPYSGTIFFDPDIITSTDASVFQSSTYMGRGMRTVFDRRTARFESMNVYLFSIIWSDGLRTEAQINPEFASVMAASVEAEKYGRFVGQLPYFLRLSVRALWIHKGVQPFGGGNYSILIHTGQSELYEKDGILEETLVHEGAHTSVDSAHAASAGWLAAQRLDPTFISTYARDNPTREDIAESILPWLAVRHRRSRISNRDFTNITTAIPNRLVYFDRQNFNLAPMVTRTSIAHHGLDGDISLYPNPSDGNSLTLNTDDSNKPAIVNVYSVLGNVVFTQRITDGDVVLDVGNVASGVYLVSITTAKGQSFTKKWIKN